ncbi:MAG: hypothetical protein ACREIA_23310 [Opitutaceae bacterium]
MNKHYIIWPVLLTILFLGYYLYFRKGYEIRELEEQQRVEQEIAEKEAARERAQQIAAAENRKRSEARAKEEAAKIEERRRKQEEKDQAVRDETAERQADIDKMAKEKGMLEAELAETRRTRLETESAAFEVARQVELAEVARRTAELEIQRAAGLIAAKVDTTSMVQVPEFPKQPEREEKEKKR